MSKCPEVLRKLERAGWRVLRRGKGSHIILVHPDKQEQKLFSPSMEAMKWEKALKGNT